MFMWNQKEKPTKWDLSRDSEATRCHATNAEEEGQESAGSVLRVQLMTDDVSNVQVIDDFFVSVFSKAVFQQT